MNFRYDINALRALAVLGVVIFHFKPEVLPGGFAGVDVFFVISGYLMTKIILGGIEAGKFNTFTFYKSRAKRIIPALLAVVIFVLLFGWFYLGNGDYRTLVKHSVSSLLFLSNFVYWNESGYFDVASQSKWLLHTWSLSAEWQFYIIYPLVISFLVKRIGLQRIKKALLILTVTLFLSNIYLTNNYPEMSYFLLPSRAWELMVGGLIYAFPVALSVRYKTISVLVGMVLIVSSYFLMSEDSLWPGYLALVPVLGTGLVLISNANGNFYFNNAFVNKIGLWSYSIYLWHWPIMVLFYFYNPQLSVGTVIAGILLSILAGAISYYTVEQYKIYKSYALTFVLSVVLGLFYFNYNTGINSIREYTAKYSLTDWVSVYEKKAYVPGGTYWFSCNAARHLSKTGNLGVDDKCTNFHGKGGVILWGDSHAGALSETISSSLAANVPYYQLASTACTATWNEQLLKNMSQRGRNRDLGCVYQNNRMRNLVVETEPHTVIIVQARQHEFRDLVSTSLKLKQMGVKQVVLLGPVPQWLPTLPVALSKNHDVIGDRLVSNSLDPNAIASNEGLKHQWNNNPEIDFIDIIGKFCSDYNGRLACKYKADEDHLMAFDYGHPTQEGARVIFDEVIRPVIPVEFLNTSE